MCFIVAQICHAAGSGDPHLTRILGWAERVAALAGLVVGFIVRRVRASGPISPLPVCSNTRSKLSVGAASMSVMQESTLDHFGGLAGDIAVARRKAAAAQAELAAACVKYADARTAADWRTADADDRQAALGRARPGEFVADEVSLLLREQPFTVRRLVARSRGLAVDLPTVWQAFRTGEGDAEQVRVIDRVARRVTEAHTLAAVDDQVVEAAQTRCPRQLSC
jgi:hypothetical protein